MLLHFKIIEAFCSYPGKPASGEVEQPTVCRKSFYSFYHPGRGRGPPKDIRAAVYIVDGISPPTGTAVTGKPGLRKDRAKKSGYQSTRRIVGIVLKKNRGHSI
jgi:hypothetical protein